MMSLNNRLHKLETKQKGNIPAHILPLIGRWFDELTGEQQKAYCKYRYCGMTEPIEKTLADYSEDGSFVYNAHFRCDSLPPEPTEEEFQERLQWVQKQMELAIEEYNS